MFGHLKTDLQGFDIAALRGAGWALDLFRCVSLEVWGRKSGLGDRYVNPVPIMEAAGFLVLLPAYKARKLLRASDNTGVRDHYHDFEKGAFGSRAGISFINRRYLPAFRSRDDAVAWPAYCRRDDALQSVHAVRWVAHQASKNSSASRVAIDIAEMCRAAGARGRSDLRCI